MIGNDLLGEEGKFRVNFRMLEKTRNNGAGCCKDWLEARSGPNSESLYTTVTRDA